MLNPSANVNHPRRAVGIAGAVLERGYKQNGPLALVEYASVAMYFVALHATHRKAGGPGVPSSAPFAVATEQAPQQSH